MQNKNQMQSRRFLSGSAASSHRTKTYINWILQIVRKCASVNGFISIWPCDELVTCPGRHSAFLLQQLAEAPADPSDSKQLGLVVVTPLSLLSSSPTSRGATFRS